MPKVVPEYKDQARARIMAAASAVFHRQGLSGTTMEDIAREVGVSKGALYLYFPTKIRLLEAIQAGYRTEMMDQLERKAESGDVVEGLCSALDRVVADGVDPGVWHRLIADSASDPEVRRALREDQRGDRENIGRFLHRLEARGGIPPMRDPEAVTGAILMLIAGAFVLLTLQANPERTRADLARALRVVLRLPPPAGRRRPAKRRERSRTTAG